MQIDLGNGLIIDVERQIEEINRVDCEDSLYEFVRQMWHVVEPATPMVGGWAMEAICEHLEAVSYGDITRLLINVPPGSSKSLLCNVFWPAWEWAMQPHLRYLSFSYAAQLTERDNRRFRDVILSETYQRRWGRNFRLMKKGEEYVSTDKTGFKVASSIGGVSTGARGDRVILDDPHNVKDQESDVTRKGAVEWFATAMSNRLNDMTKSAIVVIMQRVHEEDVSGYILDKGLPYEHLMIPAEYEPDRHSSTKIGWEDPRAEVGESFWPERFPLQPVLSEQRKLMGPFGFSGQYQQRPDPAGGGIIKRDWWQLWEDDAFPPMDYILASLDTAYTEKTMNDPSAMTIWGVFSTDPYATKARTIDADGRPIYLDRVYAETAPKVMLMGAWREHLEFGPLREKVLKTCRGHKVDRLLIENKANGISLAQELRGMNVGADFAIQLSDPGNLDKIARLYSVQHLFSEGIIHAPDRKWADMVITEIGMAPKGKYRDLTDTTSQALRHLRDIGLLTRTQEKQEEIAQSRQYQKPLPPLYPV